MELVLQLRDLVLDHLGARRAASRRTGRRSTTAGRSRSRSRGRSSACSILCVAFSMSELASALPDRRRHLLLGLEARRRRLGLVHRLVQPDRPRRRGRVGRLRRARRSCRPARPLQRQLHLQLHRSADERPLLRARRRSRCSWSSLIVDGLINVFSSHLVSLLQRRLGVVARPRRRGDRRDPDPRAQPPREPLLRVHHQPTNRASPASTTACTGSTSCRSASC